MQHPSARFPEPSATQPQTLRNALIAACWVRIDARTNPLAYTDVSGRRFGTLQKAQVRIAMSIGQFLAVERGAAMVYFAEDTTDVILSALIVGREARGRGLAGQALRDIAALADATHSTIYLEPTPIEDGPLDAKALTRLYQKAGFQAVGPSGVVMVRPPA